MSPAKKLPYQTKNRYTGYRGEDYSNAENQTVPGQAFSVRELMKRHSRGLITEEQKPLYFDVDDIEYINRFYAPGALDLTDLDELSAHVTNLTDRFEKAKLKAEEMARKKAAPDPEPPAEPPAKKPED